MYAHIGIPVDFPAANNTITSAVPALCLNGGPNRRANPHRSARYGPYTTPTVQKLMFHMSTPASMSAVNPPPTNPVLTNSVSPSARKNHISTPPPTIVRKYTVHVGGHGGTAIESPGVEKKNVCVSIATPFSISGSTWLDDIALIIMRECGADIRDLHGDTMQIGDNVVCNMTAVSADERIEYSLTINYSPNRARVIRVKHNLGTSSARILNTIDERIIKLDPAAV